MLKTSCFLFFVLINQAQAFHSYDENRFIKKEPAVLASPAQIENVAKKEKISKKEKKTHQALQIVYKQKPLLTKENKNK